MANKPETLKQITALVAQLETLDDCRAVFDISKRRHKMIAASTSNLFHKGQQVSFNARRGEKILGTIENMGPSKALVREILPEQPKIAEPEPQQVKGARPGVFGIPYVNRGPIPREWRVPYSMLAAA